MVLIMVIVRSSGLSHAFVLFCLVGWFVLRRAPDMDNLLMPRRG